MLLFGHLSCRIVFVNHFGVHKTIRIQLYCFHQQTCFVIGIVPGIPKLTLWTNLCIRYLPLVFIHKNIFCLETIRPIPGTFCQMPGRSIIRNIAVFVCSIREVKKELLAPICIVICNFHPIKQAPISIAGNSRIEIAGVRVGMYN